MFRSRFNGASSAGPSPDRTAWTVLVRPGEQTVAAGLANLAALGSDVGVAALSVAGGGGLGSYAGGLLYDRGAEWRRLALPWFVFAFVGLLTAGGLWWTMGHGAPRRHPVGTPLPGTPTPRATGKT